MITFFVFSTYTEMKINYHSFEDFLIWQEGMNLCDEIYSSLKKCNDFGLLDQIQRSSVSIPSNIAGGFELRTNKGFIRHLYISKGSVGELRTQLYIALLHVPFRPSAFLPFCLSFTIFPHKLLCTSRSNIGLLQISPERNYCSRDRGLFLSQSSSLS